MYSSQYSTLQLETAIVNEALDSSCAPRPGRSLEVVSGESTQEPPGAQPFGRLADTHKGFMAKSVMKPFPQAHASMLRKILVWWCLGIVRGQLRGLGRSMEVSPKHPLISERRWPRTIPFSNVSSGQDGAGPDGLCDKAVEWRAIKSTWVRSRLKSILTVVQFLI